MKTSESFFWAVLMLLGVVALGIAGCIASGAHTASGGSPGATGGLSAAAVIGFSVWTWVSLGAIALGIWESVSGLLQGTSIKGGLVLIAAGAVSLTISEFLQSYLHILEVGIIVVLAGGLAYYIYDCVRDRKLILPSFPLLTSSSSSGGAA